MKGQRGFGPSDWQGWGFVKGSTAQKCVAANLNPSREKGFKKDPIGSIAVLFFKPSWTTIDKVRQRSKTWTSFTK